jgi:hypothetical protein
MEVTGLHEVECWVGMEAKRKRRRLRLEKKGAVHWSMEADMHALSLLRTFAPQGLCA